MPDNFIKGLELNELFYRETAALILESNFPNLRYSAALIGWGSEVLGFDDSQSADHNWGIRFQIFLSAEDLKNYAESVSDVFDEQLPSEFRGFPVDFPIAVNQDQRGAVHSLKHNIEIETTGGFFKRYLGCDPFGEIRAADWLTFPEHKLLAVTGGKVFHDGLGELEVIRQKFRYYPRDVWLYMLAAQWLKIFEEQAFVGRTGYVGDELGSKVIAGRQVTNLMRLCFLMERKYAPYRKWFGTAFSRLDCARELKPIFARILQADQWKERQEFLGEAYEAVVRMHNALEITIPIKEKSVQYYRRPFLVVGDERIAEEIRQAISSAEIKNIQPDLGSVNRLIDSTSLINDPSFCKKLRELYA